ncbi:MAG: PHP domain-containing protein [Lawsonibacter sp.]|nr:PHP domain-containing protein [Lawsonibacter sp.]
MYLVDYHTHTCCSPDSEAPLADMAETACRVGLTELCTTDHYDLLLEDGTPWERWDWSPVLEQYRAAAPAVPPGFRLLLGLELGGAHLDPGKAQGILDGAPLDFIIGSVHNLDPSAGGIDFYHVPYPTREAAATALDDYFASLLALAPLPCYDALGHIIYPLRYINGRAGHTITLEPWADQLDALLRTVVETGRAIEVNTCRGREVENWRSILKRYRELGGELVTTGSDAHRPEDVGKGLEQAADLLRETGFRYLTLYRQRQPEPIKL